MALADLSPTEQFQVFEFTRDARAAMADVVRGLRKQQLLAMAFADSVGDLWTQIGNSEEIPDGTGLAGADKTMTKAEFNVILAWTQDLINAVYSDNGGAVATVWDDRETVDAYGVQMAGPSNI